MLQINKLGNLQAFATLHEVLDIVNDWKIQAKNLKEVHLLLGQVGVGQDFDQVSKVVATATQIRQELGKESLENCTAFWSIPAFRGAAGHVLPVERQPFDTVAEHHSRGHQQLCEEERLDPLVLVLLELNP